MIEDIEDNYEEYLDDEMGYLWRAWDILSTEEIRNHDRILAMSEVELAQLDPAGLDDLDLWAYARACRRLGDANGYLESLRLLIGGPSSHRGIDYPELMLLAIEAMAKAGEFDEAKLHLDAAHAKVPDREPFVRLGAIVAVREDARQGMLVVDDVAAEYAQDAEFLFELAEDLAQLGEVAKARELLTQARDAAKRGASATLIDIELLERRLEQPSSANDLLKND